MAEVLVAQKTIQDWFRKFYIIIAIHTSNQLKSIDVKIYSEIVECPFLTIKYQDGRCLISKSFWIVGGISKGTKEIRTPITENRNENVFHSFIISNNKQESLIISDI